MHIHMNIGKRFVYPVEKKRQKPSDQITVTTNKSKTIPMPGLEDIHALLFGIRDD